MVNFFSLINSKFQTREEGDIITIPGERVSEEFWRKPIKTQNKMRTDIWEWDTTKQERVLDSLVRSITPWNHPPFLLQGT